MPRSVRLTPSWMPSSRSCRDCPVGTRRNAPHPGPRCATHHRLVLTARRKAAHSRRIEQTYGITAEEYDALYVLQGGVCYICRRARGTRKRLAVDHDHATGEVRGLLCKPCNRNVLGHLRDDIDALQRGIDYLTNPPARAVLRRPDAARSHPGNTNRPSAPVIGGHVALQRARRMAEDAVLCT